MLFTKLRQFPNPRNLFLVQVFQGCLRTVDGLHFQFRYADFHRYLRTPRIGIHIRKTVLYHFAHHGIIDPVPADFPQGIQHVISSYTGLERIHDHF